MSNSSLVTYTKISPNKTSPRNHAIDTITIHHMSVVNGTLEGVGNTFANPARQASSNYGIDSNGRIAMYVEEKDRSWCSGNRDNDHRAITIEVANSTGAPNWEISQKAMDALINLCVDICKRNNIKSLNYTGDTKGNLTMHKWFQNTDCPGPYLSSKFPYIAQEVNKRLAPQPAPTPTPTPATNKYKVGQTVKYSTSYKSPTLPASMANAKGGAGTGSITAIVSGQAKYKMSTGVYCNDGDIREVVQPSTKKEYPGTFPTLPSRGYFQKGDKGAQVVNLQKFLLWFNPSCLPRWGADGSLGDEGIAAVKAFQKAVGIAQDGLFGNASLAKAKAYQK